MVVVLKKPNLQLQNFFHYDADMLVVSFDFVLSMTSLFLLQSSVIISIYFISHLAIELLNSCPYLHNSIF